MVGQRPKQMDLLFKLGQPLDRMAGSWELILDEIVVADFDVLHHVFFIEIVLFLGLGVPEQTATATNTAKQTLHYLKRITN